MSKENAHYERTTEGLRSMMFEAAERILNGQLDAKAGSAIASLGKEMLHSLDAEKKVAERLESTKEADPSAALIKLQPVRLSPPLLTQEKT